MQGEIPIQGLQIKQEVLPKDATECTDLLTEKQQLEEDVMPLPNYLANSHDSEASNDCKEFAEANSGSSFLRRFSLPIMIAKVVLFFLASSSD